MRLDEKSAILTRHRQRLERHVYTTDSRENLSYIAAIITAACLDLNIEIPVIVGGFAVEIYTLGGYITQDLDMISSSGIEMKEVMRGLGFQQQKGFRHWTHPQLDDVVEFPPPPLKSTILIGSGIPG